MKKITSPLFIDYGKNKIKRYYLNLNNYRNWHYQVNNNLKSEYKSLIYDQIRGLKFDKVEVAYKLYYKDKRKRDKMNIISVIDKFFMDALVESGCIEDDNDDFVKDISVFPSRVDKDNPRCEIFIRNL